MFEKAWIQEMNPVEIERTEALTLIKVFGDIASLIQQNRDHSDLVNKLSQIVADGASHYQISNTFFMKVKEK